MTFKKSLFDQFARITKAMGSANRLENLPQPLNLIAANHSVVAYCRGPCCVLSYEAVVFLRNHGGNAVRLEEGFPECKQAGFPVEVGQSTNCLRPL